MTEMDDVLKDRLHSLRPVALPRGIEPLFQP